MLAVACALASVTPAWAQVAPQFHRDRGDARAARQEMREQRMRQMESQRPPRQDMAPMPGPHADPARGRMTPDERRALRQQINDANRDIYRR